MQLKYSLVALACIATLSAEDSISISYLQYDEDNNRVSVSAPAIAIQKDFGKDYTLDVYVVSDSVSGATPTYVEENVVASSGATSVATTTSVVPVYNQSNEFDEVRNAYTLNLTKRLENRNEISIGTTVSLESDYYSYELSGGYLQYLDTAKNRSLNYGLSAQFNEILVYCASSTDTEVCDASSGSSEAATSIGIGTEIGLSQILDKNSIIKGSLFLKYEDGYLSNPYLKAVKDDGVSLTLESDQRPDTRLGYGAYLSYKNAFRDNQTFQVDYRLYSDDWGILSNTVNTKYYYEATNDLTLGFGLRYYKQSEADFYQEGYFEPSARYLSSDERLSDFSAVTYTFEAKYNITDKLSTNFSYNSYDQSTDLSATYYTLGFKYKF
ncbi:MAG: Unknown protein [uncultured Campylobacterales bacterium]|uniref:DUF3570 domain-containing protein n=1 Tax=uncultured Campylobacterales bacterium TaxID=352960 RepID=A0A6S6T4H0_9BACT|nr:MAG: Unknown protein [uncultured Campylobacterales bacterium]